MKKCLIFDTSMLCVYLQIPGKDVCGRKDDEWNYQRVIDYIHQQTNVIFVLPFATIVETGNHISHIKGEIFPSAKKFGDIIRMVARKKSPWTAFDETRLWNDGFLNELADEWPKMAVEGCSLGDWAVKKTGQYYAATYQVELFTGDSKLKSFESNLRSSISRRERD